MNEQLSAASPSPTYDVVICGAGLAGLGLGLQLRRQLPELSILLLDRLERPLDEAAFKVGESTVEVGAFYLAQVLDLGDYLEEKHLPKLGLRYFFGDPAGPLSQRPEVGLSQFPQVTSYQIDRGLLENDLRRLVIEAGAELAEGCRVEDVELAGDGRPHKVSFRRGGGDLEAVTGRWVVDAMGRRRLLQRRQELRKEAPERHNAAWFRLRGRIDVDDLVPQEEAAWHQRVPEKKRWYSTNHLMGDGYWVWLIPLSTGYTSLGIVALDRLHPFDSFNTWERAGRWLEEHEPVLAAHIADREPVDFLRLGDYSHTSKQVFSADRWACVGDAGVFADPFYSPGTDLIGLANLTTAQLIASDHAGALSRQEVEQANLFLLTFNDGLTRNIQSGYPFFGQATVMAAKFLWDITSGWAFTGPLMFNRYFLDPAASAAIRGVSARYFPLSHRVQKLFQQWAESSRRGTFDFIDYLAVPPIADLRLRNLQSGKSLDTLREDHAASMATLEELAQVVFLLALEDIHPELLSRLPSPLWLNAWAVGLDPERWEADGLFRPTTAPRSLAAWEPLVRCFRFDGGARSTLLERLVA